MALFCFVLFVSGFVVASFCDPFGNVSLWFGFVSAPVFLCFVALVAVFLCCLDLDCLCFCLVVLCFAALLALFLYGLALLFLILALF